MDPTQTPAPTNPNPTGPAPEAPVTPVAPADPAGLPVAPVAPVAPQMPEAPAVDNVGLGAAAPGMVTPAAAPVGQPSGGGGKQGLLIALGAVVAVAAIAALVVFVVLPMLKDKDTKTTPTNTTKTSTSDTAADTTSALACLEQQDYKWFSYDKQAPSPTVDKTYNANGTTYNVTGNMFFKPDSTTEDSFTTIYDDWADFAKNNENKQWKFRLEGSTFGSDSGTASSKKLANDRTEKVKSELVKRGVSVDRIIVEAPHDYSDEEQDALSDIYRRVQVIIDPTCTASTTSDSSSGSR